MHHQINMNLYQLSPLWGAEYINRNNLDNIRLYLIDVLSPLGLRPATKRLIIL